MADPKKTAHEVTPKEAIELYGAAVKDNDGDPQAHFNLATAFYIAHDYGAARTEFEQSVQLNNRNYHAHYYLGAIYARQGDLERARGEWERVIHEAENTILRAQAKTQLDAATLVKS